MGWVLIVPLPFATWGCWVSHPTSQDVHFPPRGRWNCTHFTDEETLLPISVQKGRVGPVRTTEGLCEPGETTSPLCFCSVPSLFPGASGSHRAELRAEISSEQKSHSDGDENEAGRANLPTAEKKRVDLSPCFSDKNTEALGHQGQLMRGRQEQWEKAQELD